MFYPEDYTLAPEDFGRAFDDDGPLSYLAVWDDGTVELEVVEYLDFHREFLGEEGAHLFDDYHFLTDEARAALVESLSRSLDVPVDADHETDHAHVVLRVEVGTAPMTVREALVAAWPAYAYIANTTDPGTFGVPYVFSDVLARVPLTASSPTITAP